jgi:hypothetical protein
LIGSRPVHGKEGEEGLTEVVDPKLEMVGRRSEKEPEEGAEEGLERVLEEVAEGELGEGPEGEPADRPADFSLVMWATKSLARS